MDVRSATSIGVLLVLSPLLALAQSGSKPQYPSQPHAYKRDGGFVQYTLKQINPSDVDYGTRWERSRKALVERTVENRYFWSNATAVSLLACLCLIVVRQRNNQNRRDWATAEILAQYEHALTRANVQIHELTSKNCSLANAIADKRGQTPQLLPTSPSVSWEDLVTNEATSTERRQIEPSRTAISKHPRHTQTQVQATENGNQIALFTPDVDLMMTVNSLKQQLAHSEERNTELQRRIASTNRNRESREKQPNLNNLNGKSATGLRRVTNGDREGT
jgi:hypothetical protein